MKRLIIFILILASSILTVLACGFYPYGDDIRFSILNPSNFKYADFYNFNYTSKLFYGTDEYPYPGGSIDTASEDDRNIVLWRQYCKNKVPYESINSAVYIADTTTVVNDTSTNLMLQYLHNMNDTMAINYLLFAKRSENYNMTYDDPWERTATLYLPKRTELITAAVNKASVLKNENIKIRYAFLAERLAYYNGDSATLLNVYRKFFVPRKNKNIIDYWALSFKLQTERSSYEKNYYSAQVFMNAPDKRMVANNGYNNKLSLDSTLFYAHNNNEKAAVWLITGINNPGRAMTAIKNMYTLQPNAKGLSFLLLREINKLEDWIYTPYYTYFTPSTISIDYPDTDPSKTSLKRVDSDRVYANHLLEFINSANVNKTSDPLLWNTAKAYLYCMTNKYDAALNQINQVQKLIKKESDLYTQLELIKVLCLTAKQPTCKVVIPNEAKAVLLKQYHQTNYRFIFAIARELEYKGNTTDAALLFSKINNGLDASYGDGLGSNAVYWRTKKNHYTRSVDVYSNYFDYVEAQYSPGQTEQLINSIANNKATDSFSIWEYSDVKNSVSHLYDLLGTKYIRQNELQNALTAFKKVNDTLWKSSLYDYRPLNANPFYTNFYNEHQLVAADSTHFTKTTITQTLINYLSKASDVNNKDRDYYYFLVANCYLNMTEYGNSWMMRRYFWTSEIYSSHLEDDDEYYNCTLAKAYYLKAKQFTTNEKFAALCLRMIGRCEKYKLISTASLTNKTIEDTTLFNSNKYYMQLKKDYPQDYNELISNCESFNSYFAARDIFNK